MQGQLVHRHQKRCIVAFSNDRPCTATETQNRVMSGSATIRQLLRGEAYTLSQRLTSLEVLNQMEENAQRGSEGGSSMSNGLLSGWRLLAVIVLFLIPIPFHPWWVAIICWAVFAVVALLIIPRQRKPRT